MFIFVDPKSFFHSLSEESMIQTSFTCRRPHRESIVQCFFKMSVWCCFCHALIGLWHSQPTSLRTFDHILSVNMKSTERMMTTVERLYLKLTIWLYLKLTIFFKRFWHVFIKITKFPCSSGFSKFDDFISPSVDITYNSDWFDISWNVRQENRLTKKIWRVCYASGLHHMRLHFKINEH